MNIKWWLIRYNIKSWFTKRRHRLFTWFLWRLPRSWMYWAVIRVWAHGTQHQWGDTAPNDLTWSEALKRWDIDRDD